MESWSLGMLTPKGQVEAKEPKMRRYEVTRELPNNLREETVTVEAEAFEWDKDEVCFLANAVAVYVLDHKRLVSIRDLGAAETQEKGSEG